MYKIRPAAVHECEKLTETAVKSEAYWGYDSEYMNNFKTYYSVSKEFINLNPTFVIEEDSNIVGFYGLFTKNNQTELEYFFIAPQYIGQGYGKRMWMHLIKECHNTGIKEFNIVTSPQAEEFYVKMGAAPAGEVESLLKKGRIIPKLVYKVK
ncbi:MAG: N-acetyltransferase [Eubacterium sp.]|nr:N-acetyltransferase [Eubacterium sp.]